MTEAEFLKQAFNAANQSGHIFPAYAASEAALVSKYGSTLTAIKANNLFDFRVPSKLFRGAESIVVDGKRNARLKFNSWTACFLYRKEWIERVPMFYLVRRETTGEGYLHQMARLSADPNYEARVTGIYHLGEASFQ